MVNVSIKNVVMFMEIFEKILSDNAVFLLLGYTMEVFRSVNKDTCMRMFITVFVILTKMMAIYIFNDV